MPIVRQSKPVKELTPPPVAPVKAPDQLTPIVESNLRLATLFQTLVESQTKKKVIIASVTRDAKGFLAGIRMEVE